MTERAKLPVLTLSYSDLITSRGFKYVFQTSATAGAQAEMSLPVMLKLAEAAGTKPKTVAIITDNTAASVASVKPMRERLLKELGLQLVVDETWTPPLADATPLIQKVRQARPDLLFSLPTAVSDAKLILEKLNEFGLGQGRLPTIGFGIVMAEPDMLKTMDPAQLEGLMLAVGSWGAKGHEKLIAELKSRYNEPWMTQNAISTYADMWVIKEALENAKKADREAVAAVAAQDRRRTVEVLPGRSHQVRRQRPPRGRGPHHRAVAEGHAGDGVSAGQSRRRQGDLAEEVGRVQVSGSRFQVGFPETWPLEPETCSMEDSCPPLPVLTGRGNYAGGRASVSVWPTTAPTRGMADQSAISCAST